MFFYFLLLLLREFLFGCFWEFLLGFWNSSVNFYWDFSIGRSDLARIFFWYLSVGFFLEFFLENCCWISIRDFPKRKHRISKRSTSRKFRRNFRRILCLNRRRNFLTDFRRNCFKNPQGYRKKIGGILKAIPEKILQDFENSASGSFLNSFGFFLKGMLLEILRVFYGILKVDSSETLQRISSGIFLKIFLCHST